jgi:hypothetical protein
VSGIKACCCILRTLLPTASTTVIPVTGRVAMLATLFNESNNSSDIHDSSAPESIKALISLPRTLQVIIGHLFLCLLI